MDKRILGDYVDTLDTELGKMTLTATLQGITSIVFAAENVVAINPNSHTEQAKQELAEYFSGRRQLFCFAMTASGTDFQKRVWQALMDIPYGTTATYGDIAQAIGKPKAVRAVGAANGKNPLSIVVPCHRIIGKSGALTGYAGGIQRKSALLELENKFRYKCS